MPAALARRLRDTVAARVVRLPPAQGPLAGRTGGGVAPWRVVILGESTAAGVGVDAHDDGMAGQFGEALRARTGRSVRWRVLGGDGLTARAVRHVLVPQLTRLELDADEFGEPDIVVLLTGVNDLISGRHLGAWRDESAELLDAVRRAAPRAAVVVSDLPDPRAMPALPAPLGHGLRLRSRRMAEALAQAAAARGMLFVPLPEDAFGPEMFAADGFHPSAAGYRAWADLLADAFTAAHQ